MKEMKYKSQCQDESGHVAFWVHSPGDKILMDVDRVYFLGIVDLDNSGFYASNTQRTERGSTYLHFSRWQEVEIFQIQCPQLKWKK